MDYQKILDKILSIPMFQNDGGKAYNPSLDKIKMLCELIGSPQNNFKVVHVAGTNGKGSVTNMLATIFEQKGYKTALYTSPHQKDFRERIKIDGEMISKEGVMEFMELYGELVDRYTPSFFELTTSMAFWWFSKCEVDIAIVECGLGGRLDATNVVNPILSIITNISHDHNHILGNSLSDIAREKGGIIKERIPLVIGEWDIESSLVLIDRSKECESETFIASQRYHIASCTTEGDIQKIAYFSTQHDCKFEISTNMLGSYQAKNIATVLTAIDVLEDYGKFSFSKEELERGLNSCRLKGRYQYISHTPRIVCDSGHNRAGIEAVTEQLRSEKYDKLIIVLGVVADKEIDIMLSLMPKEAYYIFTKSSVIRALDEKKLEQFGNEHGLFGESVHNIDSAIERAKELAGEDDLIFVGGSCFTVAEAL